MRSGVGGWADIQGTERESKGYVEFMGLGAQCINTCRSEDKGLKEVRQRDNPPHHIFTVDQHQTMYLIQKDVP